MSQGQQQEIFIDGKLKIGLPASASVSSSHDKKQDQANTAESEEL